MQMDGSQRIKLTDHPARDEFISWSPDSTHIVYRSYRGGENDMQGDLFVIRSDGTEQYRLTANARRDIPLQWSPDGANLLLHELETNSIVIVAQDGSLFYPLAKSSNASWSPDGTQIAFTTRERDIYGSSIDVIQVNGTAQRPVTLDENMLDSAPTWSPDGTRLAFGRRDARPAYFADNGLYVVNADGSGLRQLVYLQSGGGKATWSPDGAFLLYTVDGGPGTMGVYPKPPDTIYVVDRDGGEPRAITQGWGATWQP
jgi:Tol biopolymer transport system component